MNDFYLIENSTVLKNLLGITEEKELDLAEADLSRANMMLLYEQGFDDFSPGGFLGKIVNLFTFRNSDPEVTICRDDIYVGSLDDSFGDELVEHVEYDPETGEDFSYMALEFLGLNADGFVYLEAGLKYELNCYNFTGKTSAFSVNAKFIGAATIRFIAPEKTVYSIAAGDAGYNEDEDYYSADLYPADFTFDVTLTNGRHFTIDGDNIEYIAADISIDWEETLGDCRADIYILGQTFTFEYTITR